MLQMPKRSINARHRVTVVDDLCFDPGLFSVDPPGRDARKTKMLFIDHNTADAARRWRECNCRLGKEDHSRWLLFNFCCSEVRFRVISTVLH